MLWQELSITRISETVQIHPYVSDVMQAQIQGLNQGYISDKANNLFIHIFSLKVADTTQFMQKVM